MILTDLTWEQREVGKPRASGDDPNVLWLSLVIAV